MNRDYKCRADGKCFVGRSTENLKQVCQACRFQQCIRAGMKLDCEFVCCVCMFVCEYVCLSVPSDYEVCCVCIFVCVYVCLFQWCIEGECKFIILSSASFNYLCVCLSVLTVYMYVCLFVCLSHEVQFESGDLSRYIVCYVQIIPSMRNFWGSKVMAVAMSL